MRLKDIRFEAKDLLGIAFLGAILLFALYNIFVGVIYGVVEFRTARSISVLWRSALSWGFGTPYVRPSSTIGVESQPVLFVIVIGLFVLTAIAMSFALSFVMQSWRSEQEYWRRRSSQSLIDHAIRESIDERRP